MNAANLACFLLCSGRHCAAITIHDHIGFTKLWRYAAAHQASLAIF